MEEKQLVKKLIRFDWAMKYILRNKANFDVLEGFLTNLLKEKISVESLLESESNRDQETRKFNRVDLKCLDSKGRHIIVEIQNQREVDYLQRLLWGTSKVIVESLDLGHKYGEIAKVISVSILYHPLKADDQGNADFIYHGATEMIGLHTKRPLLLQGRVVNGVETAGVTCKKIFPEYYFIYVQKFEDIINEALDEWVYFFKHGEIRNDFKSPGILLAQKKLDFLSMNESGRKSYEEYLAYLGEEWSIIDTAKDEGRFEGKVEGLVLAIELGLKLKFGSNGLKIMPEIEQIKDSLLLETIVKGFENAKTVDELCKLYKTGETSTPKKVSEIPKAFGKAKPRPTKRNRNTDK